MVLGWALHASGSWQGSALAVAPLPLIPNTDTVCPQ